MKTAIAMPRNVPFAIVAVAALQLRVEAAFAVI